MNLLNSRTFCPSQFGLHTRSFTFPTSQKPRQVRLVVSANGAQGDKPAAKTTSRDPLSKWRPPSREEASLRAEAEAPFRSLRVVLFGVGCISASLASLFQLPRVIGSLAHAPNAAPAGGTLIDMAINVGALALCGYFLKRDLDAREQQISRLLRADQLGACQLELSNGRLLRLAQVRGFARAVLIAGTPAQVAAAIEAAEPYKQVLIERGVLVVGLPMYGEIDDGAIPPLTTDDLRYVITPFFFFADTNEYTDINYQLYPRHFEKG